MRKRNKDINWFPDYDMRSMSITKQGHGFDKSSSTETEGVGPYEYNIT